MFDKFFSYNERFILSAKKHYSKRIVRLKTKSLGTTVSKGFVFSLSLHWRFYLSHSLFFIFKGDGGGIFQNPICKIKLDRKKPSMLGSDKHHICLKGTNINDLYSSYHNRACNDRGLLQRGNTY
ncbi:hypothetical protein CAC02_02960 [Streptococcus gallolyticus]|uniref:Uncharacterized protein n=1 Tax=Streptococcus gallolyticus TaxID=315405 RepID=A0A368UHE7_9STRE|nr:hypothetical protein CAC02_02960 [Streptococcus gallolyticus]